MSTSPVLRTLVRQPRYESEAKELLGSAKRADDVIRGLEALVCRHPEWGMSVPGRPPSFASWVTHHRRQAFQVLYRYSDEKVYLLSVRSVPTSRTDYLADE